MQSLSLIFGIVSIIGFLIGFFPCLGALNWLNIPFAGIGLILSIIASVSSDSPNKSGSITGIILCSIAILGGMFRLFIGGGVI